MDAYFLLYRRLHLHLSSLSTVCIFCLTKVYSDKEMLLLDFVKWNASLYLFNFQTVTFNKGKVCYF